jgi:hypothetical protein
MNPRVKDVKALPMHKLMLTFTNGEKKEFDMTPYLDKGVFRKLKDENEFGVVKVFMGSVVWRDGQDLCPDTLYEDGVTIKNQSM